MTLTARPARQMALAALLLLWACVPFRAATAAPDAPVLSGNILKPLTDPKAWAFLLAGDAKATITQTGSGVMMEVTNPNPENWHVQLVHLGTNLQEGQAYILRFRAKADATRPLGLAAGLNQPDYHMVGLLQDVQMTTDWQDFTIAFTATKVAPGKMYVPQFQCGNRAGKVWLADIYLGTVQTRDAPPPPVDEALTLQPGEVRLEGTVRDLAPTRKRLTLLAMRAQDHGGAPQPLEPPRPKVITVGAGTTLRPAGHGKTSLSAFQPGDTVIVIGKSLGEGKPLAARLISGQ